MNLLLKLKTQNWFAKRKFIILLVKKRDNDKTNIVITHSTLILIYLNLIYVLNIKGSTNIQFKSMVI
jgi:hypothetical protein